MKYFLHHQEHCLVIEMIQEPDVGLTRILLEGNTIAIHNIHGVSINLTQEGSNNTLTPIPQVHSVEMIHNREEDQRMNIDLGDLGSAHLKKFQIINYQSFL